MKWFKKNRFNIFTYLFCAFSMALLFIVSFSCKTYAYTTDNGGIQWNWQSLEYTQSNSKLTNCTLSFSVFDQSYVNYQRSVVVNNVNLIMHKNNDNMLYLNLLDLDSFTNIYDYEDGETNTLYYNNERITSWVYITTSNSTYFNFNFDTLNSINYYSNFKFNFNNNVDELDSDFDEFTTTFYLDKINDKSLDSRINISNEDKEILYGRVNSMNYTYYYSSLDYNFYNSSTNRLKFSCYCNCSNDMYKLAFDNGTSDFNGLPYINIGTTSLYFSQNNINDYLSNKDFFDTDTYSKNYYDTLQQQYNTLESDFNTLNNNYNTLQNNYNTLNNNYTQLQNDYNTLNNNYNNLNVQYNDLINTNNYGYWNYIDYVEFYINNSNIFVPNTDEQNEWSINDLTNYNILKIGGYFDTTPLTIEPYQSGYTEVDTYINFKAYTPSESFLVSFNHCLGCNVIIYDNNSNSFTYTITEDTNYIDINLIREYVPNFDLYVIDMKISPNSAEQNGIYFANNNYIEAYNKGYNNATNNANRTISGLESQIDTLSTQLNNLQQSLNLLQTAYNDLNQSYQNFLNGNNFANLFFTIAETPFASFKQIWSVDFLGVNLAGFVTGILFIGVLIWVVKKIF